MMRTIAVATAVLCLVSCFVFDNIYDNRSTPTATFQIIVQGGSYAGTYLWTPADRAFEGTVGITGYYVYMDSTGYWCLANQLNKSHLSGSIAASTIAYCALPPTTNTGWYPPSLLSFVDDSAGGVCRALVAPDSPPINGNTLQVTFKASDPGNGATYQWESSSSPAFFSLILVGTMSTYLVTSGGQWIRAIITPTDSTGTVTGSPVVSQPVYVP